MSLLTSGVDPSKDLELREEVLWPLSPPDSLTGRTTYRLLELVRTEPEPSLFEVPCNDRIVRSGS